jgi:hypothetical protein
MLFTEVLISTRYAQRNTSRPCVYAYLVLTIVIEQSCCSTKVCVRWNKISNGLFYWISLRSPHRQDVDIHRKKRETSGSAMGIHLHVLSSSLFQASRLRVVAGSRIVRVYVRIRSEGRSFSHSHVIMTVASAVLEVKFSILCHNMGND